MHRYFSFFLAIFSCKLRSCWLPALFAFAATACIAMWIFDSHPFCMDEYNYWYQAQIFAQGKLFLGLPDATLSSLLELYVLENNGRVFSKYPPLTSAIMAIFTLFGNAALTNPVLSAGTVIILFSIIKELTSLTTAWMVTTLFVGNAFFLSYGASFYSHPLSLFLTSCGLYAIFAYQRSPYLRYIVAAGLAVALLFMSRPFDALCVGIALGFGIIAQHRWWPLPWKPLLTLGAVTSLGPLAAFSYNWFLIDCFCLTAYPAFADEFRINWAPEAGIWSNIIAILTDYWHRFQTRNINWFKYDFFWLFSPVLTLLGLCALKQWRTPIGRSSVILVLAFIFLYNFHAHPIPWPQYGQRYWFPMIAGIVILAGFSIEYIRTQKCGWLASILMIAGLCQQGYQLTASLSEYRVRFVNAAALREDIESTCPAPSIVVLANEHMMPVQFHAPFLVLRDYKRNPFFYNPRIFLSLNENGAIPKIKKLFPHYRVCYYPQKPKGKS